MAYIKNYRTTNNTIAGLPDTTNIQDAQLRLYLDRLNVSISTIVKTLNDVKQNTDTKSIIDTLTKEKSFLDFISQEAGKEAGKEVEKAIKKNGIGSGTDKNKNLRSISISPSSLNIKPEESTETPLEVSYNPDDILNYQRGVTWSSSDENIATVDENGNVTSHQIGNCIIEAVSKYDTNIYDSCYVYVSEEFDIFVFASNKWISDSGEVVYTEESGPAVDDLVWNTNEEITVHVPMDLTVEEAKIQSAYGMIVDVDNRDYFISDKGNIYWRDEAKDVDLGYEYEEVEVEAVYYAGNRFEWGEHWDTLFYGRITENGTIQLFSKANHDFNPGEDDLEEYDFEKQLFAENIEAVEEKDVPRNIFIGMQFYLDEDDPSFDPDDPYLAPDIIGLSRYIIETGRSVTLKGVKYDNDSKWIEISTFDGELTGWFRESDIDILKQSDSEATGSKKIPEVDKDGYIKSYMLIGLRSFETYKPRTLFKYNDTWYVLDPQTNFTYVYKRLVKKFFAWSSNPGKSTSETVFSKEELPEKYGDLKDKNLEESGSVSQLGHGAYSIKTDDDTYYSTSYSDEA